MSDDESSKEMEHSSLSVKKDLPQSKYNLTYDQLIKININYLKSLSKILKDNNNNKENSLSKSDFIVLDELLNENLEYMNLLFKKPLYQVEFANLFSTSISLLNLLSQFNQKEIFLYEQFQRIKFLEMKFHSLIKKRKIEDLEKSEEILKEIEEIQKKPLILKQISLINIASIILYKGMVKFYMDDLALAEKYGIEALDILERKNFREEEKEIKRISKMSNILEFLAQIYDLKKDFKSANSCYEKAYYLNIGKYGLNNKITNEYKRKKEEYENNINQEIQKEKNEQNKSNYNNNNNINDGDSNYNNVINEENNYYESNNYNSNNYENENKSEFSNNDFVNRKLISGNISNAKGSTDTFSFKIPVTNQIEPFLISIYQLTQDQDRFNSKYFIANMYFNKKQIFQFLQINQPQNYLLYTDEALNLILEKIEVENGQIYILDGFLNSALIR